jgi:hypothetical protein
LLRGSRLTTPNSYLTAFPREAFPRKEDESIWDESMFATATTIGTTIQNEGNYLPELGKQGLKWFLMSHCPGLDNDVHDEDGRIRPDLHSRAQKYMI